MIIFFIFYSGVLLTGEHNTHLPSLMFRSSVGWGQPTLYPLSIHACPNETVTYYCHGSQISVIAWVVPPYITWADPIQYAAEILTAIHMNREDKFFATLTNITRLNGSVADMTTSLKIITYGIRNETTITCKVVTRDFQKPQSSSTLYLTGLPPKMLLCRVS